MRDNFDASFQLVLKHEGGFVNDPADPGGATNLGITIGTLSDHLGRPATVADVRAITKFTAGRIYRANYWDRARCDDLPVGLDYAVFDFAVNSGVSRAVRTLQRIIGVKDDGVIGAKTMTAIKGKDARSLIVRLCDERLKFVRGLRTFTRFGKGWTTRIVNVKEVSQNMTRTGSTATMPEAEVANAPAREENAKALSRVLEAILPKPKPKEGTPKMNSLILEVTRILLRYASGILITKGILAPEVGATIFANPEVVQIVAGLLAGAVSEIGWLKTKMK